MATGHSDIRLVTSQPSLPKQGIEPANETASPEGILFLLPISFMLIWSAATVILLGLPKLHRQWSYSSKAKQIPCFQCRYFVNSPYLNCTVNPKLAMTAEASDCSDYESKHQTETLKSE